MLIGTALAAAGVSTWTRWNLLLAVGAADDVAAITMPAPTIVQSNRVIFLFMLV
ncbi:MAG TPA: hypothetical protein VFL16_14605 [Steroidobacteraceae bacterium]|jgi:hypothetical protein|nr:hypothetical protein [Steroidobacteraceae bacterium]